jgi:hypothetical protein
MATPAGKDRKRKVLVIGREVSDFLCPLFQSINEKGEYEVHLLETRDASPKQAEIIQSFASYHTINTSLSFYSKTEWVKAMFSVHFWKGIFKGESARENLRNVLAAKTAAPLFSAMDIFNIQFLTNDALYFARFIPKNKKLVLSFWGSDLFQCNTDFSYREQERVINRSAQITLHSSEMKNIFLSKFGRHLQDKVHHFFLVDMYKALHPFYKKRNEKEKLTALFREKYGIDAGKTVIAIGHSAHDIDNHIQIIEALKNLRSNIKNQCFFLLPMTYGAEPGYLEEVEQACKQSGICFKIFSQFLPGEDITGMRFCSEIVIRLSKFDAFSLSICETVCSGNIVVAGTWLPYGVLRAAGIYYRETDSFDNLTAIVEDTVANKASYLQACSGNAAKMMQLFQSQNVSENLTKLFSAL